MARKHDHTSRIDTTARWLQRHIFWLLVACYGLAALWPAPGLTLRDWQRVSTFAGEAPLVPLILLAVLLFAAALRTDLPQVRLVSRHPLVLAVALLSVWLGPALLVLLAGWVVPRIIDGQAAAGLLVGMALVATMPVANSSVGWTQTARGNLGLGLALVVLTITLSPWVTPNLLRLLGLSFSETEQRYILALVTEFSGLFFIFWVILPTAAGLACRYLLSPARVESLAGWCVVASAVALLLLNYVNSALAMPHIHRAPISLLATTAALAAAISLVGLGAGWAIARLLAARSETQSALMFALSMKHTGLALILAGAVLARQPWAILMIILATLIQHLLAAAVQWWVLRSATPDRPPSA